MAQGYTEAGITVRPAGPADIEVLLSTILAAFAEYRGQLTPPSGAHAESAASLQHLFDAGEMAALALVHGEPAGCVFLARYGAEMYAHRLAVLPAWRKHGIGQALMLHVKEQALAAGCRYTRVAVRLALPGNIDFFTRLGYRTILASSHPGFEAPTFVHMTHELAELQMRAVVVKPYDPAWPAQFEAEAAAIRAVLGEQVVDMQHIGSTSVPGLAAKPVIDIMPLVSEIRTVDRYITGMAELGYVPRGEYGLPGRRYFSKNTDGVRSHHVHVYASTNPEVMRHLAFRDYLRTHPDAARQYGELKLALAQIHPRDIEAYMDGKDGLIKTIEAQAIQWRQAQPT